MYSFLLRFDVKPGDEEASLDEAQRMVCVATWETRVGWYSLSSQSGIRNILRCKYFVFDEMDLSAMISMKTIMIARRIADQRKMKGGAILCRSKVTGAG